MFLARYCGGIIWGGVILLVFIGTIIPSLSPLFEACPRILKAVYRGEIRELFPTLFYGGVAYILFRLRNMRITKKQMFVTLLLLAACSLALRTLFIISFDQEYYSDFLQYWNSAAAMVSRGLFSFDGIHHQRAIPWFYPLAVFFGNSDYVFKFANIFALTFIGLIASFISAKWFSRKSAIFVFVVFSICPETYYASLIPTHDIPGALFLTLSFLFSLLCIEKTFKKSYISAFFYAALLCLSFSLLEIQRSLSIFFTASMSLAFVFFAIMSLSQGPRGKRRSINYLVAFILVVCLPWGIFNLSKPLLNGKILDKEYGSVYLSMTASTFMTGPQSSIVFLLENYTIKVPQKDQKAFTKSLFLSDLYYSPLMRPISYIERSKRAYTLGSQLYFYIGNLKGESEESRLALLSDAINFNVGFYLAFFLSLIAMSIYFMFYSSQIEFIPFACISFMSLFSFGMIMFGENQPRYFFLGYFLWPLFLASFFSLKKNEMLFITPGWNTLNRSHITRPLLKLSILAPFIFAAFFLFMKEFKNSPLRMLNLKEFMPIDCDQNFENTKCPPCVVEFDETFFDRSWSLLNLRVPSFHCNSTDVRAAHTFLVDNGRKYSLGVFVENNFQKDISQSAPLDVTIAANNKTKIIHLVGQDKPVFVLLEDIEPENGKISITFDVASNAGQISTSSQETSFVSFRFARLYPTEAASLALGQ